jgi:hypothetical protein
MAWCIRFRKSQIKHSFALHLVHELPFFMILSHKLRYILLSTTKKVTNADTNPQSTYSMRMHVICTNLWLNVRRRILTMTASISHNTQVPYTQSHVAIVTVLIHVALARIFQFQQNYTLLSISVDSYSRINSAHVLVRAHIHTYIHTYLHTWCEQKIPRLIFYSAVGTLRDTQGQTVNQHFYLQVLKRLTLAVFRKRPQKWAEGARALHHDNAPAHTAHSIQVFLAFLSFSNHPTPLTWLRVTFGCSPN